MNVGALCTLVLASVTAFLIGAPTFLRDEMQRNGRIIKTLNLKID